MPGRRRKRSPADLERERSKKAKTSSSRRGTTSAFSSKQCAAWFREYTTTDENCLGPEGMEKFCEDIGVEPENVVMLALAWKLQAQSMGFFRLEEWMKGMTELQFPRVITIKKGILLTSETHLLPEFLCQVPFRQAAGSMSDSGITAKANHGSSTMAPCDCVAKVQSKLDSLRALLNDPPTFKSIFRFAFDFAKEQNQRSLDTDTAKAMLTLLLGGQWPLHSSFSQFLDQHSRYKVMNKDQWCNILEFSRSINPDLSNYDEDGAWPVMLDEFVEWLKEERGHGQNQIS